MTSRLKRDETTESVSRETKLLGANRKREKIMSLFRLTRTRIGNLTRLIHTLAICDGPRLTV